MKRRDFDYDELRTFVHYVDTQSTVATARALGVTQPTVSYTLQRLERRFPMPLFSLVGKRKVLSPFGVALHRHAKAECERFELRYRDFLHAHASGHALTLRVAGRLDFFFFLRELGFDGTIQLQACSSQDALSLLVSGRADVAFTHVRPSRLDLVAVKLYSCRFAPCAHRAAGIEREADLTAERLGARRLALLSPPDEPWFKACGLARRNVAALAAAPRIYCENWILLQSFIAADKAVGVNWLDSTLGPNRLNPELHFVEALASKPMHFYMLYARALYRSEPYRRAIDDVRAAFARSRLP